MQGRPHGYKQFASCQRNAELELGKLVVQVTEKRSKIQHTCSKFRCNTELQGNEVQKHVSKFENYLKWVSEVEDTSSINIVFLPIQNSRC